ncbi:hypothetical protein AB0F15_27030 [Amycolatopsis sp. NPDC026612]|uniref:hypothetical protein n=1 Tax=Amycolatopsis sp. NPDC026612 TaxID=3155466 RepID=UPI0033E20D06
MNRETRITHPGLARSAQPALDPQWTRVAELRMSAVTRSAVSYAAAVSRAPD